MLFFLIFQYGIYIYIYFMHSILHKSMDNIQISFHWNTETQKTLYNFHMTMFSEFLEIPKLLNTVL